MVVGVVGPTMTATWDKGRMGSRLLKLASTTWDNGKRTRPLKPAATTTTAVCVGRQRRPGTT